ncbi:hypothetical protein MAPG_04077 [Magnaporthiopsis poae ATCC 64411]|uniref:AAA+ ATPase domain-containing protein n=1 Tax=Magnaporthiopsis poae (strain ATCC 64411 / 73-15) TaxID=644358 RepID=A0A0C4DVR6_MAGP6|nr:hypothetical protein MAPG_04077 [Magnaporthiopsis poae ATCC 64411]
MTLNLLSVPIVIPKPYYALFHFRNELEAYTTSPSRTANEREHMGLLLVFMKNNLAEKVMEYNLQVKEGYTTFDLLPYLFRQGQIALSRDSELRDCMYFKQLRLTPRRSDDKGPRVLEFEGLTWRGDPTQRTKLDTKNYDWVEATKESSTWSQKRDDELAQISKKIPRGRSCELTELQAALGPCAMPGFALDEKIWGWFKIENIRDIWWNDNALDRLVLDTDRKDTIRRLVEVHQASASHFDDITYGKGKGLVFSLHGPPGTGKTLTAECIAEHTRRPLYRITSGDLGTSTNETNLKLGRVFRVAEEWKAIVLLDEADVFMAKRQTDSLERNALVSVFLRSLEGFQGIIFLTTNRSEEFDEAITSRIHLSYHFPPLDAEHRAQVWRSILKQNAWAVPPEWLDESESGAHQEVDGSSSGLRPHLHPVFKRLGQEHHALNGRDIKNICSLAASMSRLDPGTGKLIEDGTGKVSEEMIQNLCNLTITNRQVASGERQAK